MSTVKSKKNSALRTEAPLRGRPSLLETLSVNSYLHPCTGTVLTRADTLAIIPAPSHLPSHRSHLRPPTTRGTTGGHTSAGAPHPAAQPLHPLPYHPTITAAATGTVKSTGAISDISTGTSRTGTGCTMTPTREPRRRPSAVHNYSPDACSTELSRVCMLNLTICCFPQTPPPP